MRLEGLSPDLQIRQISVGLQGIPELQDEDLVESRVKLQSATVSTSSPDTPLMQLAHGYTFRQWLALSSREKFASLGLATLTVVAPIFLAGIVGGAWVVVVQPWMQSRQENALIDSLAGKQYQRNVDASLGTDFPYRYLFDKCLDRVKDVGTHGDTELSCKGNVRVLATNDAVLGRGNTIIPLRKDGTEITIGVAFGEWRETLDRQDLRDQ